VDYCGPFQGGSFLVITDAKSKWLEVLRMSSTTAEATVNALRTVFATHGLPEELVTDNGAQFIAQEFKDFLRSNKIKHVLSAPYHPASNGEAERAVKTFKQSMKAAKGDPGPQNQKITSFLLSYRTTPHTTIAQLKDLSGTKIQPEAVEVTEDLLLQPSQVQPTAEPVLLKEYSYSPPQAKDYSRSLPQEKLEQTQTKVPLPQSTSTKDFPKAKEPVVKSQVKPPQRYPQRVRKPPKRLIEEA